VAALVNIVVTEKHAGGKVRELLESKGIHETFIDVELKKAEVRSQLPSWDLKAGMPSIPDEMNLLNDRPRLMP
jgi:hypothetical protein